MPQLFGMYHTDKFGVQSVSKNADILNSIEEIKNAKTLIIVVANSNDCFKCNLPLSKVLSDQRFDSIGKFIISDEYVTVKSLYVNLRLKPNYLVDPGMLDSLSDYPRSYLILKQNNTYSRFELDSLDDFFSAITKVNETSYCNYNVQFVDTVLSSSYLHRAIYKQGMVIFDHKSQIWASVIGNRIHYNESKQLDSTIVYSLPSRADQRSHDLFKNYSEMQEFSKTTNVPILRVNGIFFKDNLLCVSFLLNRYYREKSDPNKVIVYTSYFVGTLEIKDSLDILNSFDLNRYNNFFFADLVQIEAQKYPIRIFSTIDIISHNELVLKVNKADDEKRTTEFYGSVKVKLDYNLSQLIPVSLTKEDDMVDYISEESIFNNCRFRIRKEMTDRNKNIGTLSITTEQ
jgi:hypothetical protein